MGRPLYTSTLLARYATEATQPEPSKPTYPVVEKWSRWNAFDPDSDEFFQSDNAVYEAFLTEDEIAEHAQAQQREAARLLAERLLREAEADSTSASSPMTVDLDRPAIGSDRISASRPAAVQMEVDVETITDVAHGDAANRVAHSTEDAGGIHEGGTREVWPSRRQPRRAHAISEQHTTSTGEINPTPVDAAIPRISVVSVDSRDLARGSSRSPSPDPLNLVSGLQYLSESPRPLMPVELPARPISPIPNTPARVSGVFATPPPAIGTAHTISPAPTMTPRILTWGSRSDVRGTWVPETPTPAPRVVSHYLGSRLPTTPAPLTY